MTKIGDFLFEWRKIPGNQPSGTDGFIANVTYNQLKDLKKYWPGNTFPVAVPKCGFKGEKCKAKVSANTESKKCWLFATGKERGQGN